MNIGMTQEGMQKVCKKKGMGKYMSSKSSSDYLNYTKIRNELRALSRSLCASFEHKLVNDAKDNPKAFWNYARSKTRTKSGISDLRKDNGSLTSTDLHKRH